MWSSLITLTHFCLHQVRDLQKKMQHVENDLDITIEKLSSTTTKLDEKDKSFQLAEGEIQLHEIFGFSNK